MRRRKSPTRRAARKPAPANRAAYRYAGVALLWFGTLGASAYALHRAEPYALGQVNPDTRLVWVDLPSWLEQGPWRSRVLGELETSLDTPARPFAQAALRDPHLCEFVAKKLAASGWVERIERVAVLPNGEIRAHADFRKPWAMVEHNGRAFVVDRNGARLPYSLASETADRSSWFLIRGLKQRTPPVGQRWSGDAIEAGLDLAEFLYAENEQLGRLRDSILAIDVANFDGRIDPHAGRLRLVMKNPGSYIHWGVAPGKEYGVEASAERKLHNLCDWFRSEGGLPNVPWIDVRDKDWIDAGDPR